MEKEPKIEFPKWWWALISFETGIFIGAMIAMKIILNIY